jgi:sugar lactone lactonase YvrE
MNRILAAAFCALLSAIGSVSAAPKRAVPPRIEAPAAMPHAHYKVEQVVKPSPMHGIHGLAFGPDGALYAASITGHSIYRIDVRTGAVSTFLGPPRATADDLAFAPDGSIAWTGASQAAVLMRGRDGKIRTVAQDMPGVNAINFTRNGRLFFTRIFGGDGLYEADPDGTKPVRVVAEKIGGLNAFQIAADDALYGPLFFRGKIVKVDIETGAMTDVAAGFQTPSAVKIEADGHLVALDYNKGDVVRVDPKTGEKTVLATLPPPVDNLAIAKDGTIYVSSTAYNGITAIDPKTLATRRITWGDISAPGLLATIEQDGHEQILLADAWGPRVYDPATGAVTPIKRGPGAFGAMGIGATRDSFILSNSGANGGTVQVLDRMSGQVLANLTNFGVPYDVKPLGDGFVVADYAVGRLTKVANDQARTRTTFAWNFDGPVGLADGGNGIFYVAEYGGRISRVDSRSNEHSTVIEGLDAPEGIALAPDGRLIVAEVGERRVLAVDIATGRARILADKLPIGLDVGPQVPAPFLPTGVAVTRDGAIYVAGDIDNSLLRLTPPSP